MVKAGRGEANRFSQAIPYKSEFLTGSSNDPKNLSFQ